MTAFPADVGDVPVVRGDSRTLVFAFKADAVDGVALDLTDYGSVVTASARKTPDGTVLIALDTSASDLANGVVAVGITPSDWESIGSQFSTRGKLGFDAQIADSDGSRVTTVVTGKLVVSPDYTHDVYGTA